MGLRYLILGLLLVITCSGCGLKFGVGDLQLAKSGKTLVVATTDYQTGELALLNLESRISNLNFSPIHSDAVVRSYSSFSDLFVINRLGGDNIQRISRTTGRTLKQFSLGQWSNPQDMLVEGDYGYVSCLGRNALLKINLNTGNVFKNIDLSQFADSDGLPEAAQMSWVNHTLWVQLQRLDQQAGFVPTENSQVAIIDPRYDVVINSFPLKATNPVTAFKETNDGFLLVAEAGLVGSSSELDGGIEMIDPQKIKSLGFITTEKQLGGDLIDFECVSDSQCVAIVSKPQTELVVFDRKSGEVVEVLVKSQGLHLREVLLDKTEQLLYVADANPIQPSIRVFSVNGFQERIDLKWKLKLPPFQMKLLE